MNTSTSLLRRASKPSNIVLHAEEAMTPPMATRSRSSSVESFDEEYFSKTYVPLSNLPTPPLSSHSNASTRQQSPEALFSPGEYLDPELLGPAIHLANLIPSSTSLTPASTPLIHALLTRASLPLETIALAVCILDSLNSRFALQWRKSCPLNTPRSRTAFTDFQPQHIDSINPELIPLSALILAVKFLDDAQQSTREYVNEWGRNMWSCKQVNYTQWCLMDNLGGRLLPLWDEGVIIGALEDMERAARQVEPSIIGKDWDEAICFEGMLVEDVKPQRRISGGHAVLGLGEQLTPVETPLLENVRDTKCVSEETKKALRGSSGKVQGYFQLPDRTAAEEYSACVDPSRCLRF